MSLERIIHYAAQIQTIENRMNRDKYEEIAELDKQVEVYKSESNQVSASLTKINSDIRTVTQEIANSIHESYIDQAYSNLSSELKFWNIQKPVRKTTSTVQQLEDRLKKLLIEKKRLESVSLNQIEEKNIRSKTSIQKLHDNNRADLESKLRSLQKEVHTLYNEMQARSVKDYDYQSRPYNATKAARVLDIGNAQTATPSILRKYGIIKSEYLKLPYSIDLTSEEQCYGNLFLEMETADDSVIGSLLTGLMMKYLESFPKKRLKFGIYSKSLVSVRCFSDFFAKITTTKEAEETDRNSEELIEGLYISHLPAIAENDSELNNLIATIQEQEESVSKLRRSSRCKDIFEMYEKGIDFEPFQCIVLHNVFEDSRDDVLQKLLNCIKIGVDAGARFIIVNSTPENEYKNDRNNKIIDDIKKRFLTLTYENNSFKSETVSNIRLIQLKDSDSLYSFMDEIHKRKETPVVTTYEQIGFDDEAVRNKAFDLISIPVGVNGIDTWSMKFACVANAPIANLIIGLPKSGKSTLIDSLILNGAMKYSPEDLNFQLIDFKSGISASVYTTICKIPHVTVVSENNTAAEADIIIDNILRMSTERVEKFKQLASHCGRPIPNIVTYNKWIIENQAQAQWKKMARVIIIVDECQSMFVNKDLADKTEEILRQGRSQGIHVILATQRPDTNMRKALEFVEGRYCFKVSEATANEWLPRQGKVVQFDLPLYTALATNDNQYYSKIRIAYYRDDMGGYAKKIRKRWEDTKFPINPLVIGDKTLLSYNQFKKQNIFEEGIKGIPLGEDYETHKLIKVGFNSREQQSSMFILGNNQRNIDNVLLSTALCARVSGTEMHIVDATPDKVLLQTLRSSENMMDGSVHLYPGTQTASALRTVFDIYKNRNPEENAKPVLFVINSMHSIDLITKNQSINESEEQANPLDQRGTLSKDALIMQQLSMGPTRTNSTNSTRLNAKETLLELVSYGYSRGIFMCVSTNSCSMFDIKERGRLLASNYVLVTDESKEASIVTNASREGTAKYTSINENMMLLCSKGNKFYRFRVINY